MMYGYDFRIVPVEGGRFMIRRDDGTAVMGDKDFPSETVAIAAFRELATAHGMGIVVSTRDDGRIERIELERREQPR